VGCLILTSRQVRVWRDTETLFRHALAVTTNNALAHMDLGFVLAAQYGRTDEAMEHFGEAVRIRPNYNEGRNNLGVMLAAKGRLDEAIEQYRLALANNPRLTRTHSLLGSALNQQGKKREALAEYQAALDLEPDHVFALNDVAWMLATDSDSQLRNGARAVELAERAVHVTDSRTPQLIGTLAAAYAEAGRFKDAVKTAEKAVATATAAGLPDLAARNKEMLEIYRAGKAYRDPAMNNSKNKLTTDGTDGTDKKTNPDR
jgi:tetratricopeptide (TPR) repeat protein